MVLSDECIGQGEPAALSGRAFLESMARSGETIEDDPETCGSCHYLWLSAQVARDLLADNTLEDSAAIERWSAEFDRRWKDSKFSRLWAEETVAGRNPKEAFARRGWQP